MRGKVWPLAIGNELNINQTLFSLMRTRALRMNAAADREQQKRDSVHQRDCRLKLKQTRSRSNSLDDGAVNAADSISSAADVVLPNDVEMIGAEHTMRYALSFHFLSSAQCTVFAAASSL